jgi:hypothetical protein
MIRHLTISIFFIINAVPTASANSVGKIDNPYVEQLENEIEYELIFQDDNRPQFADQQQHRLSYAQSISDRWSLEAGIVASNLPGEDLTVSGYELEARYQITEQGEFNNDWGIKFEMEQETDNDVWELGATLIVLHEWKKWIGTANLAIVYESDPLIDNEIETELATQLRYRGSASFEPGIEFFKSQSSNAAGPSFSGRFRLGGGKKIFWSTAALRSFDSSKPDNTLRFSLEYEF